MSHETLGDLCGVGIWWHTMLFTQQTAFTVVDKPLQLTVRQTLAIDSSLLPPHLPLILFRDLGTNLRRKPWGL